jgi:hypothetical protein
MACPGKRASATLGMPTIKMILSFVSLTVPNQLGSFFATALGLVIRDGRNSSLTWTSDRRTRK